jgi:hypothetical protein
MIAHFYLMAESFKKNGELSNSDIEEKIKRLSEDVALIYKYKETNKLYTNYDDLYPQIFYKTYTVEKIICNPQELKNIGVDGDVIHSLQLIIERSNETSCTSQEVIDELLNWNDSKNCHGMIAFHQIDNLDDNFQIIYGIDGWYKFRRFFLGKYPENSNFFIEECKLYFPNLYFHLQNKYSVNKILQSFSKSIVKHLGFLNDVFYTYRAKTFINESEKYRTFSIECNLEEYAASKDDNLAKDKLTYHFLDKDNNDILITCYSHLRLCRSDNNGDTKYYTNRIYFHEGIPNIEKGNILIGHIGKHRES